MYATARIICAVARQHMLPPLFARIHPKFKTPAIATVCQGISCAVIALFTGECWPSIMEHCFTVFHPGSSAPGAVDQWLPGHSSLQVVSFIAYIMTVTLRERAA